ncbi:MAG: hypothetical protein RR482_09120 [Clostridia bacterium]
MQQFAIAILVMIIVGVLLYRITRKREGEPQTDVRRKKIGEGLRELKDNMTQYAHLTPADLENTSDDALLTIVLSNLWGKMAPGLEDALEVISKLSEERQRFYAVYTVYGDVKQDGFSTILNGKAAAMLLPALELLETLEAPQTAALLQRAMSGEEDASMLDEPFTEAFDAEKVREQLASWIRMHAAQMCD